jgi:prophage regulatory protein
MSLQAILTSSAAHNEPVANADDQPVKNRKPVELPASLDRDRMLDSAQAANFLGISLPHLRRLYRAKRVPPPIMIGYRKYGWQAGVLVDFVSAKTEKAA